MSTVCLCLSDLNHRAMERDRDRYTDRRRQRQTDRDRESAGGARRRHPQTCSWSVALSDQATWKFVLHGSGLATGSVCQSLADHVREFKLQAFDFGPYNHTRYDQAPKGVALVRCALYLTCWLRAGLAKAHAKMLRNILQWLKVKSAHEFLLNPIPDVDFNGFVAFAAKRTNLMLYHLRRLRRQDKFQGCLHAWWIRQRRLG